MGAGEVQEPATRSLLQEELARVAGSPLLAAFGAGRFFGVDHDLRFVVSRCDEQGREDIAWESADGQTLYEALPEETAKVLERVYRSVLAGEPTTTDVRLGDRIFEHRLAPVRDGSGESVGVIGFAEDVSESRRAERALRESELQLRLTVEHAPIGEAIVELDGSWRRVNPALTEILGYSEEELLRSTFQDITHPDDLDLDLNLLRQLVAGDISSYEMQKRYVTASSAIVWVLLSVSLVRDERDQPLYFVSQILDVTRQHTQQVAMRDLTAMLAHDLRTPTTVITGHAETMLAHWDDATDDDRRNAFRRIGFAAASMRDLMDNSLTASALDAEGLRPRPTLVRLDQMVHEVLEAASHPFTSMDLSQLAPVQAWVDRGHLERVLSNLVTNAVKYGGARLTVATTAASAPRVALRVADHGTGVPASFVPHLFERFTRAESARASSKRGSGLGLYIARDLLRLNSGEITYADTPGGGATFVVELPTSPRPR